MIDQDTRLLVVEEWLRDVAQVGRFTDATAAKVLLRTFDGLNALVAAVGGATSGTTFTQRTVRRGTTAPGITFKVTIDDGFPRDPDTVSTLLGHFVGSLLAPRESIQLDTTVEPWPIARGTTDGSSFVAPDDFAPLAAAMTKGRAKYPAGCTVLALLDEAGEVAHAINKRESLERVRDELLDVAGVAMRLYLGEVDSASVLEGLTQRKAKTAEGATPATYEITYFKRSGKYYTTDEGVVWPTDAPDHSGWNPLSSFHRIKTMNAVCMESPHGFPQFSPAQRKEDDDLVSPTGADR